MSSKTSFFNKSVIRSDFRRFWWISGLHTVGIFLFFTFLYLEQCMSEYGHYLVANQPCMANSQLYYTSSGFYVLSILVPVGLSAFLFSYLHGNSSATCMHGIPVSRKAQYASHLLSGMVLLVIPILINALVLLLFRMDAKVSASYRVVDLFLIAVSGLVYEILSFSAASLVMMLVGNAFAGFLMTFAFAALPAVAEAFVRFICELHLFGFQNNNTYSLIRFLYAMPVEMMGSKKWILYLALSVVFVIGGGMLYRMRNLENHSELIAFPKLRPIFVYGVGICCGCAGYLYLYSMTDFENLLLMIPFGILGLVIAQMLVRKSFRVFRTIYRPAIGFSLAVLILSAGFTFDLFGYEHNVPSSTEVARVSINQNGTSRQRLMTTDNMIAYAKDSYDYALSDPEELALVEKLHRRIVEEGEVSETNSDFYDGLHLEYELKNGKKLVRYYQIDTQKMRDELLPVMGTDKMRAAEFPILAEQEREYFSISVLDKRIPNGNEWKTLGDKETIRAIVEALKADCAEVSPESYVFYQNPNTTLQIFFSQPAVYEKNGEEVPIEKLPSCTERYVIRSDYKHTIALLASLGFYDALPKTEDVEYIGIQYFNRGDERVETEQVVGGNQYDKVIREPEQIAEIYTILSEGALRFADFDTEIALVYRDGSQANFDVNSEEEIWNGLLD